MLMRIGLPVVSGFVVALLVIFGLLQSQTQKPDTNPASNPVLSYGDQS